MRNKLILTLIVSLLAVSALSQEVRGPSERLIKSMITVESHGDLHAIGDKNLEQKAYGPLQVRQPVCDDINRRYKTNYKAEQCLGNLQLSIKLCQLYTRMWGTKERLGRTPTDADYARIWNGGPTGWKRKTTEAYLAKVIRAGGIDSPRNLIAQNSR